MGDKLINMVVEIPRGARAKLEMQKEEKFNPIAHDLTKDGELRYINYSPILYNYGFIPQTWENPDLVHNEIGLKGDGDPLDVIDVGYKRKEAGDVIRVKVIGALPLVDEGEIDWKILVISLDDPLVNKINNPEQLENLKPGVLDSIKSWYKLYKTADGKKENAFLNDGKLLDQVETFKIIGEGFRQWKSIENNPLLVEKYHFVNPYNK